MYEEEKTYAIQKTYTKLKSNKKQKCMKEMAHTLFAEIRIRGYLLFNLSTNSDSEFKIYTMDSKEKDYVSKVLTMARDDNEINGGDVYYFPGNIKRVSHYAIKNKCLNYGFNVITINSDGAKLFSDPTDNKKFEKIRLNFKLFYYKRFFYIYILYFLCFFIF